MLNGLRLLSRCLTIGASGAALILSAFSAQAERFDFHSGMSSHHSFSNLGEHQPFAPVRPSSSAPPGTMPPPPTMPSATGPRPTLFGMGGGGTTTTGTGTTTTGTGTTTTGMTGTGMHHHHHHFDDDDFFFDTVFPFPDPFFVDVVQPVYVSPNNEYWYWCPTARAYYPWVQSCDVPWQPVPASPPPPPPDY